MVLSELEKAKIIVMLDVLGRRKEEAEKRLQEKSSLNISAWQQYGSELCGASMVEGERIISDEIRDIQHKFDLLTAYKNGEYDVSDTRVLTLKDIISGVGKDIEQLTLQRQKAENDWKEIELVKSLIA